jgi:hypothetical protein
MIIKQSTQFTFFNRIYTIQLLSPDGGVGMGSYLVNVYVYNSKQVREKRPLKIFQFDMGTDKFCQDGAVELAEYLWELDQPRFDELGTKDDLVKALFNTFKAFAF